MNIIESRVGDTNVLALSGAVDTSSAPALTERAVALCGAGTRTVLLDLDDVAYLTSAAFRSFIAIDRRAGQVGVGMALCGLNELVRDLFEASGLSDSFRIYQDQATALAAIEQSGAS
jgi:anti-sigma B factor antagonist